MGISLLDTQGNPQRTPSSCEPCHILLWPAENMCPSPCTYKDRLSIPSIMHVSMRTPLHTHPTVREKAKRGPFFGFERRGSCMRK